MRIAVTQKHIDLADRGTQFYCETCPVNKAIEEALGLEECSTGYNGVYLGQDPLEMANVWIPWSATQSWIVARIRQWDYGFGMEPFEFEL